MKDNQSVLEAELEYAVKIVRAGYANAEQAARMCGVRLTDLQARLAQGARGSGSTLPDGVSFFP